MPVAAARQATAAVAIVVVRSLVVSRPRSVRVVPATRMPLRTTAAVTDPVRRRGALRRQGECGDDLSEQGAEDDWEARAVDEDERERELGGDDGADAVRDDLGGEAGHHEGEYGDGGEDDRAVGEAVDGGR